MARNETKTIKGAVLILIFSNLHKIFILKTKNNINNLRFCLHYQLEIKFSFYIAEIKTSVKASQQRLSFVQYLYLYFIIDTLMLMSYDIFRGIYGGMRRYLIYLDILIINIIF